MALTRKDVLLLNTHKAVPHARFGNERAWSVTGGNLKRGQIVTTHAMCTAKTAIKAAIKQDAAEQAAEAKTKIVISLPEDAAVRLVDLLNAQTPEGEAARKALGVVESRLHPDPKYIR